MAGLWICSQHVRLSDCFACPAGLCREAVSSCVNAIVSVSKQLD